jgi:hypothetical protein
MKFTFMLRGNWKLFSAFCAIFLIGCSTNPTTPDAQNRRGVMYADGKMVPKDDTEAVRWFRLAAEKGNADAQNNLGLMYNSGRGIKEDDKEAVKWFRLAAEQGNAAAQNNLGLMYKFRRGLSWSDKEFANPNQSNLADREAVKWFRLASAQGNREASTNLTQMMADGRGLSPEEELQRKAAQEAKEKTDRQRRESEALERERQSLMIEKWRSNIEIGDSCWVGPLHSNTYMSALIIDIKGPLVRVQYDGNTNYRGVHLNNGVKEEWVKLISTYPISAIRSPR